MNSSPVQDQITAFWDAVAPRYDSPDNVASPGSDDYDHWVDALRSVLPASPAGFSMSERALASWLESPPSWVTT